MPLGIQGYYRFIQDWFRAALASVGELVLETLLTDRTSFSFPEGLASQRLLAAGTHKVLFMPIFVQGFYDFLYLKNCGVSDMISFVTCYLAYSFDW